MREIWDDFVFRFCKVDVVCWHGEPNWLGWIVIGVAGIILGAIILFILTVILRSILDRLSGD